MSYDTQTTSTDLNIVLIKQLNNRFETATDEQVTSWIEIAAPIVNLVGFPKEQLEYATRLYAAHVGFQMLNSSDNVNTETMGPITRSHFDWSGNTSDPFLVLYNKLLEAFGLGTNRAKFI